MSRSAAAIPLSAPQHNGGDDSAASMGPQAARSKRLERQTAAGSTHLFASSAPQQNEQQQSRHATNYSSVHVPNDPRSIPPLPPPPPAATVSHPALERLLCAPTASCHVQIAQLQDEKDFLAKYVERILNQLRALLHKHGELEKLKLLTDPQLLAEESERSGNNIHGAETDGDERHGSTSATAERFAPWLTSQEFTNPLFQAYDLKIYELERSVDENKKAMDRIVARAEALAKENTSLRQEMEAESEKLMLRAQHEPRDVSLSHDVFSSVHESGEYLGEINERIDVLMSENNMLMEQVSLQDDELSAMRKELQDRDEQLQVMGQNFNQATLALTELRDASDVLRDEKTRCEHQLQQYAARIAHVESQREALTQQLEALQTDRRSLDEQLLEYESLLASVKKNAERKDEASAVRYQNVCARLRELNSVVEHKEQRIDELEDATRLLQHDLDAARHDCEGMLNVLTGMEKQLTQYCEREDAVAALESDCKAKVEEVVLEKEQLAAHETQSRREVARLLERLKQQTAEHLRALDDATSASKRKHESELQARDDEVRTLSAELAQLRVKLDVAGRSQRDVEKKLADATRRFKDVSDAFEKKLRHFSERAAAAEEAKDLASQVESEYVAKLRARDDELAKLRAESRERTQELSEKLSALEREVELRRTDARDAKDAMEEKSQRIQLLNEQLQKVKGDCASRFTHELEAIHAQNRELRAHVADVEYRLTQAKRDAVAAVEAARSDRERTEARLVTEVESLKARVSALKDERSRTEKLRQTAESQCSVYALQLQQLTRDLSDAKELLTERDHACDDADRKVSELSAQLTLALSKQQQFYRQERELRTSLERLTIEKTRMEREVQLCRKKLDESRGGSYAPSASSRLDRRAERHALYDALEKPAAATQATDVVYQVPS